MLKKILPALLLLFMPAIIQALESNKIVIAVCSLLPTDAIQNSLNQNRYSFKVIQVPKNITDPAACQTLWLGKSVPLENAIEIKNVILKSGIKLHYIGISGDYDYKEPPNAINHTIIIGGSTYAAESQGIKELNNQEFDAIFSVSSLKELHENIRKTYSIASKRFWMEKLK